MEDIYYKIISNNSLVKLFEIGDICKLHSYYPYGGVDLIKENGIIGYFYDHEVTKIDKPKDK